MAPKPPRPPRVHEPLPGDLVIARRAGATPRRLGTALFVFTLWPSDEIFGGPYQSYGYALRQATTVAIARRVSVWRNHAHEGLPAEFELLDLQHL